MKSVSINSAERVKAAINHKETDRVPLDIGGTRVTGIHVQAYHVYRKELGLPPTNPPLQIRYFQLPNIDEDFRLLLGVDVESINPLTEVEETDITRDADGWRYIDRWSCKWFMPNGGSYFDVQDPPLAHAESIADLEKFPWPKEDSDRVLAHYTAEAGVAWKEHERALFIGRTSPCFIDMLFTLCGYEKGLTDLALNPEFCEALMDKILELKITYYSAAIDRVLASGIDYFVIDESDDLGTQNGLLVSPDMYRKMVKPRHTELFSFIKKRSKGKAYIELHSCGAVREIIPDFVESGVELLNPIQVSAKGMDDTRALKKEFGDALTFHGGGIDTQNTLAKGTPQAVRDEVRRRLDDLAPGGGFIFTPVHSIQHDVPFENFMAMIEAYREYTT